MMAPIPLDFQRSGFEVGLVPPSDAEVWLQIDRMACGIEGIRGVLWVGWEGGSTD